MGRSKLMADGIKAYRADGTRVPGYCKPVEPEVAAEREQEQSELRKAMEKEIRRRKKKEDKMMRMLRHVSGCGVGSSSEPYVPTQEDEENTTEEEEEIVGDEQMREHDEEDEEDD